MGFITEISLVCQKFLPEKFLTATKKINVRKVPVEKARFALRIDIIAQKLAPVASDEVGEYLYFPSQFQYGSPQCFCEQKTKKWISLDFCALFFYVFC